MKILVACEESQAVTIELRKLGHEAYSCDLQPCSGGNYHYHIVGDVLPLLNGNCTFETEDGNYRSIAGRWDMIIAHPTCTYLTNSGVCWLYNKDGSNNTDRWNALDEATKFFKAFLECDCDMVAIENPIPHKYAVERIGRKYDQCVQPWMFGHTERKATCFWLKGLPKLKETNNVKEEMLKLPKNKQQRLHYLPPGPERAKLRSKTFLGIAKAMAEQWAGEA